MEHLPEEERTALTRENYNRDLEARRGMAASDVQLDSRGLTARITLEEEKLVFQGLEEGRQSCRDILITHNLRLVVYIARRFENTGINIEDLISIGTIGLIKAVNTFQPDKKIRLATYASRCIENAILT